MNNSFLEIGKRKVGIDYKPLVIAEIGINHGGSLEVAKQMVDSAIRAGAEVIKHQTHIIEDEMIDAAKNVVPGNASESIYNIMASCALTEDEEYELKKYTEDKGAIFISTPFSRAAADRLEKMGVVAYKIGSGECNNYPLIEHVASFGKPVILSTGMNTIESIKGAVEILRGYGVPFALLHCTNLYPTPDHLIRLGGMVELQSAFPDAVIGLSDHSIDNLACIAATALGASVLERHFTDHKQRPGPDIVCSMDEQECRELIENVARVALMRGGSKTPAKEEQVTANFAFACVVSLRDIKEGETFSMENIWVKRPGTGDIPARDFKKILGARATRDIKANTFLKNDDVEGWRV